MQLWSITKVGECQLMPRQILTVAFILTLAVIALPACTLLPNEPWMGARIDQCKANDVELVQHLTDTCPPEYITQYCRGLAVIALCEEE